MGFSLKEIRSGAPELFDIQVLLELLGDPINDEIELGEPKSKTVEDIKKNTQNLVQVSKK